MKNINRSHILRAAACICIAAVMLCASFFSVTPFELIRTGRAYAEETAETLDDELSVDPTGKSDGYSAVLYDSTNGLPTSDANTIAETAEGFIWIGSYSGLIRYDGQSFDRFDSTTGIANAVSLYVDSRNRLWIGTNDSGAAVMDKGDITYYNKSDGLKSLSIRSTVEDENGNIYLATTHGIAVVGEDMVLQPVDEPQINEEYVRMLRYGSDNVIYGATMNGAVFTMKDGKLTGFYDGAKLGISDIHSIEPDIENPGYVYIGTKKSLVYYGELKSGFKNPVQIDIAPLEYVNSLKMFNGYVWICADNGIGMIHDGEFTRIENVPLNSSVEYAIHDYQGNLWFVSSKQGVMKIVPNQFTDISLKYKLPETVVNSTCIYNNQLFVGSKNDGLTVIDQSGIVPSVPITSARDAGGAQFEANDLLELLSGNKIRSIIRDSKNRLWISTFSGNALIRYDNGEVVRFGTAAGLPSERVRAVYERSDGTFMVACTGGVALIDGDEVTELYGESAGISNTEVLTVAENINGDMLIGTDGDGIYVVVENKVVHYGTESGLGSDVIMRIKKDRTRDIFWIVTSNSIAYMTPDYQFHTIKNFPYSNNFDLYQTSGDEMWILSSNGIYVLPTEEMMENGRIDPVYYGRENGLPCFTTSNSYSEVTDEGELYIAGSTGVAKVNIETPYETVNDVKLSVPYVEADGKPIYPDGSGKIVIPAKTRKVTIYPYVFNYSLMNPQVTYYLDGFDTGTTTVRRSELLPVSYTNLRGGTYHFKLQIKDAQGRGNKEISIRIVKERSFYEMLWFKVVCVLAAMAVIFLIVVLYIQHRTRKFLKKEQENKLLIREIVEAFAKVIDMKDKYTNGHSTRVAEYTSMLTKELGYDEETVEKYYNIALMHDIGKIGVPSEVLNKPGKLTDTEFNIIKSHSALGYNALKNISIMPELAIGAGSHHERPDGKGYPKGLKGDEIPRVAQIIAVADTFDAMYSDRPYRKRMNFDRVVSIMKEVRGTQLTEDVVDAFLRLVDKGEFRAPDDDGGGTTEDIDNIHKKQAKEEKSENDGKEADKKE